MGPAVAEGGGPVGVVLVADAPAPPEAAARHEQTPPTDGRPGALPRWVRPVGWGLLALQLTGMLVFSTIQYRRFGLTNDFANYSQAWWAIAHGDLDPFSTGLGVAFWKNNAEFALWPLALLYHLFSPSITLLWVQDVVVTVTELVCFAWTVTIIEGAGQRIPSGSGPLLAVGTAAVLVADPWVYETIAFDFHFEALATLFTLLVAFRLWSGRIRSTALWVPLALISSGLAAFYLVGVGLSGVLAGRSTRRWGAVIAAVGALWFWGMSALGGIGVGGTTFVQSYGYLLGSHRGSAAPLAVVAGVLSHPGAAVAMAGSHATMAVLFLIVFGLVGVLSPWGFGVAFVVIVPSLIDGGGNALRSGTAFQSWPAMPFVLIGTVMLLVRLLESGPRARRVATVTLATWAGVVGALAIVALPTVPRAWLWVSAPTAAELARIEPLIPTDAEVVVSAPVMGRFAEHTSVYGLYEDHQRLPVDRRQVVFIFGPYESFQRKLTRTGIAAATADVENRLRARLIGSGAGVRALVWSPPPGTTHLTLP